MPCLIHVFLLLMYFLSVIPLLRSGTRYLCQPLTQAATLRLLPTSSV